MAIACAFVAPLGRVACGLERIKRELALDVAGTPIAFG
jgi:hypothetical protein